MLWSKEISGWSRFSFQEHRSVRERMLTEVGVGEEMLTDVGVIDVEDVLL